MLKVHKRLWLNVNVKYENLSPLNLKLIMTQVKVLSMDDAADIADDNGAESMKKVSRYLPCGTKPSWNFQLNSMKVAYLMVNTQRVNLFL